MVSDIGIGTLLFGDTMIGGEVEAEFFNLYPEALSFVLPQFTSAPLVVALGNVHVAIEWTYTKGALPPPLPSFLCLSVKHLHLDCSTLCQVINWQLVIFMPHFCRLDENYETVKGACLPRSVLYTHYQDFCKRSNIEPSSAASFGKVSIIVQGHDSMFCGWCKLLERHCEHTVSVIVVDVMTRKQHFVFVVRITHKTCTYIVPPLLWVQLPNTTPQIAGITQNKSIVVTYLHFRASR